MTRYVLTAVAEADMNEIVEFIAIDSPRAARGVLADLRDAMRRLAEFPDISHRRAGLPDGVKLWPAHSYLIIYKPAADPLLILRVLSGFRDLERLLG